MAQLLFLLQTVRWSVLAVNPLTAVSLAGQCCTRRLELLVSLRSVLAEGPSNGSYQLMMARQTTRCLEL